MLGQVKLTKIKRLRKEAKEKPYRLISTNQSF